jgi:beta-lactamase regulating signal transducer with metallopeptidase domain/beta-phosphoglucomutase-like phosphatase (HAD superfamily)
MSDMALHAAAWLLTYALHSTVLLGLAALLSRRMRGEAWRDTLWKAALVGGLLTATVQTAGWMDGDLGRWRLAVLPATPSARTESPAPNPSPTEAATPANRATDQPPRESSIDPGLTVLPQSEQAAPPPSVRPVPVPRPQTPLGWAVLAWAMGAAGMLLRLFGRQARLRGLLAERAPVEEEAVLAMLAQLRRNAGFWRPVRLTECAATPTPLALGGGEICVPPRFRTGLDPEQQRSALAHELAHLARRDPAWHFAASVLEAVFFFQPLNRLARARLRESAEFLCDAWAARQTGSPLGLARCLAEVASWVAPGRHPIPAGTMAMAEGGSPLVQRVQRLTSWRGEPREGSGALRFAVGMLLVSAVAAVAPAIASTDGARRENPSAGPSAATDGAGQEIVVIRHPDPAAPLGRRWTWAVEEMGRRGLERAWIAWSVPSTRSPGPTWIAGGSGSGRMTVNRRLGAPEEQVMMLFSVARDGQLEHAVGHSAEVDFAGRPVVWLGPATGMESFAELRRLADGLRDPNQREHLVEAAGLHDAEGVVPYLAAVLGRDGSNGVRREAATALGRHPTAEAMEALRAAVRRDGSEDVRREAVEAMGRIELPQSVAYLRELALYGRDEHIRSAAVEAFSTDDPLGVETLTAIASAGADLQVARDAVEALEHASAELATPILVRIAWTGRTEVARQAAESLGRLPAPWSVDALDSIARTHPDPAIAQQATESLGRFPDAVSGGYLRRLARTHPSARVREEAFDQLRASVAASRGDPDPDSDPDSDVELDPGSDPDPDIDPDRPSPKTGGAATP